MQIKRIKSNKNHKIYKIDILLDKHIKNEFFVGDTVLNKINNMKGKISKIENNIIFVNYEEDKTFERIDKNKAFKILSYVDDIQDIIDPMSPQISNKKIKKAIDNLSKSGEMFELEETKIDKSKLKINSEYEDYKNNKERHLKENKVENLVNLGISKGIIDKDEFELEKIKLLSMNERDFNEYENNILNFDSKSIVSSKMTEMIDPNLTEAEKALLKIKNGENVVATNIDYDKINVGGSRNLETLSSNKPSQPIMNGMINENDQFSIYNKNNWMAELDWTLLSRN